MEKKNNISNNNSKIKTNKMGCVSSKHKAKQSKQENYSHHVVSLTSSTYGVLGGLDKDKGNRTPPELKSKFTLLELHRTSPFRETRTPEPKSKPAMLLELNGTAPFRVTPPEIINAWELMEGIEEEMGPRLSQSRRSPKTRPLLSELDPRRSPLRFLNQLASPKKIKKSGGKENKNSGSSENSPKGVPKDGNNAKETVKKPSPRLWASIKGSPRCESLRIDSGLVLSRRRSLGPQFDPELVAAFEKEVSAEEEEIKKMVSFSSSWKKSDAKGLIEAYKKNCPPGGENGVVLYTTTLRGIRKTFEDCNLARSVLESHNVRMLERDVSMDSGYKEELRGLVGSKEVRVPLLFVKGRLIGGADEVARLDEEGKLGILLSGIPRAVPAGCKGCTGIRFVLCYECSGSCRLLADDGKRSLKCGKCNENGLIHCPICG